MNNYLYLFQHTMKNRIRSSLKKPVTYIYFVVLIGYIWLILSGLGSYVEMFDLASGDGLITILTCLTLFSMPGSIWTLSKKKGLIFKLSDIHFLFQMPMNPKGLLLYGYRTGLISEFLMQCVILIGCFTLFRIPLWVAIGYFVFACVIELIFEVALMICIYGNETLSENTLKNIRLVIKVILLLLVVLALYIFIFVDSSLNAFHLFVFHPLLQLIPVVGWALAPIHLIINGFSLVSMIGTVCYVVMVIATTYYAYHLKCVGEYFEDAMTYANEYQEIKKRSQKGEIVFSLKNKKVRKAHVTYKGKGARAIFYRQLLEYKKKRFFIFSMMTIIYFVMGCVLAYFFITNEITQDMMAMFILGGMAYIVFIFSNTATKWSQELESIYLYLIPDSRFKKVFYSTIIEHIKSFIDGVLITLPIFIVGGLSLIETIMIVCIYVSLQSVKLYLTMVIQYLLGQALGKIFQQILQMLCFMIVITIGIVAFSVGLFYFMSLTYALLLLFVYAVFVSLLLMSICTLQFDKMEKIND